MNNKDDKEITFLLTFFAQYCKISKIKYPTQEGSCEHSLLLYYIEKLFLL